MYAQYIELNDTVQCVSMEERFASVSAWAITNYDWSTGIPNSDSDIGHSCLLAFRTVMHVRHYNRLTFTTLPIYPICLVSPSPLTSIRSGVFKGAGIRRCPLASHTQFLRKIYRQVHGRLVRGLLLQAHLL